MIPDAFLALDYMLDRFIWIVDGLVVYPERMLRNLDALARARVLAPAAARARRVGPRPRRGLPARAAERDAAPGTRSATSASSSRPTPRSPRASTRPRSTASSTSKRPSSTSTPCFDRLRTPRPEGGARPCLKPRATSPAARSASSTPSTTTACCSSPATASRPSTSCCRRRSPTRAASSPGSRRSGSRRPKRSSPNHLLALREDGRSTECRRLEMLPIECVVRGYLAGSGWKDYLATGEVCGHRLPAGPRRVRPAARADLHAGDEGADRPRREHRPRRRRRARRRGALRRGRAADARALPLRLRAARSSAGSSSPTRSSSSGSTPRAGSCSPTRRSRPTRRASGPPTSTRPAAPQPSFDKQFVRDYCETLGWDKTYPGPELPDDVVDGHARPLRRGVRAPHRDRLRRLPRRPGGRARREGDRARPAEGRASSTRRGRRSRARCGTSASPSARRASAGSSSSTLDATTRPRRAPRSSGCASSCSRTR